VVICTLAIACLLTAPLASAEVDELDPGTPLPPTLVGEGGFGMLSALLNLVYAPVKLGYVVGGLTLSGVSWAWTWGDSGVSNGIYRAALAGDYVVTPEHLTGKEDLEFSGN
jgi:hypothetical protein